MVVLRGIGSFKSSKQYDYSLGHLPSSFYKEKSPGAGASLG
jgi:hypothetical protein